MKMQKCEKRLLKARRVSSGRILVVLESGSAVRTASEVLLQVGVVPTFTRTDVCEETTSLKPSNLNDLAAVCTLLIANWIIRAGGAH